MIDRGVRRLRQLVFALLAAGVVAAPSGAVAAVVPAGAGVSWVPTVSAYAGLVLTVSCPDGSVLRDEFASGGDPFVAGPLGDGLYVYELRYLPRLDADAREALARARETGDLSEVERLRGAGRLPQEPVVQSGTFRIVAGALVPSDGAEETSSPESGR